MGAGELFGAVGAAPDEADEEGAEGGEAGGYDGYGGFGCGPDGGGDEVPWGGGVRGVGPEVGRGESGGEEGLQVRSALSRSERTINLTMLTAQTLGVCQFLLGCGFYRGRLR